MRNFFSLLQFFSSYFLEYLVERTKYQMSMKCIFLCFNMYFFFKVNNKMDGWKGKAIQLIFPLGISNLNSCSTKVSRVTLDRPWHCLLNCGTCTTPLYTTNCSGKSFQNKIKQLNCFFYCKIWDYYLFEMRKIKLN